MWFCTKGREQHQFVHHNYLINCWVCISTQHQKGMQIHHGRSSLPPTVLAQSPGLLESNPSWAFALWNCCLPFDFQATSHANNTRILRWQQVGGFWWFEGWVLLRFLVRFLIGNWFGKVAKNKNPNYMRTVPCWKPECLECREGCCAFQKGINLTLANDHSTSIYDEIIVPGDTLNDHGWNLVDLPFLFVVFRLIVFSRRGSFKLQNLGVSLVNSRILSQHSPLKMITWVICF